MKLNELNHNLLQGIVEDEHKGGSDFLEKIDQIDNLCSDKSKIYSRFDLPTNSVDMNQDFIDGILLSTLFSDTVKLFPNSNFGTYQKTTDYTPEEIYELLSFYDIVRDENEDIIVSAGTFSFREEDAEILKEKLTPLFESERLTLSPNRNLLIVAGADNNTYTVPTEKDPFTNCLLRRYWASQNG